MAAVGAAVLLTVGAIAAPQLARIRLISESEAATGTCPVGLLDRITVDVPDGELISRLAPENREDVAVYFMQEQLSDFPATAHNSIRMVYYATDGSVRVTEFSSNATNPCSGARMAAGDLWGSYDLRSYVSDRAANVPDKANISVMRHVGNISQEQAALLYARMTAAAMAINGEHGRGRPYYLFGVTGATVNSNAGYNTVARYAHLHNRAADYGLQNVNLYGGTWAPGGNTNLLNGDEREQADRITADILASFEPGTAFRDIIAVQRNFWPTTQATQVVLPAEGTTWNQAAGMSRTYAAERARYRRCINTLRERYPDQYSEVNGSVVADYPHASARADRTCGVMPAERPDFAHRVVALGDTTLS
ncbi:MAG: hypothetical protein AB7G06_00310 [Bdellovibrionales bacterium]